MKTSWKILNAIIIANFIIEILYCFYQIFFVLVPEGAAPGPLIGGSLDLIRNDFPLFEARRLYATENWLATGGLAIYLAIVYREKLKIT